jgi:hypothetical protein
MKTFRTIFFALIPFCLILLPSLAFATIYPNTNPVDPSHLWEDTYTTGAGAPTYGDYRSEDLVELDGDWEILGAQESNLWNVWPNEIYCVGVIRYLSSSCPKT